ncbi:MAG: type II toxin-antitoxin system prevent-host-death family antitoxin [Alphaproteobacteria bacterium]|nr:type II toxin-antitoxin system prevent-host-death family antitoxin [Alphaproteobacteria bacterium]
MKNEVAISEFKAHCLELICKLETNKKIIVITKRNKPVAKLIPFERGVKQSLFGSMKSKAIIKSDITKFVGEKWDAEND